MNSNKILSEIVEFEDATGQKPSAIYLGRKEMIKLLKFPKENNYISCARTANITDYSRPDVNGILAYEVNSESHFGLAL